MRTAGIVITICLVFTVFIVILVVAKLTANTGLKQKTTNASGSTDRPSWLKKRFAGLRSVGWWGVVSKLAIAAAIVLLTVFILIPMGKKIITNQDNDTVVVIPPDTIAQVLTTRLVQATKLGSDTVEVGKHQYVVFIPDYPNGTAEDYQMCFWPSGTCRRLGTGQNPIPPEVWSNRFTFKTLKSDSFKVKVCTFDPSELADVSHQKNACDASEP